MKSLDIPPIAKGTYLPTGIELQIMKEEERQQQMDDLKRIADSAESHAKPSAIQADLAVKQSDKAEKLSKIANIKSNISFIMSSLSVIGVLLANADKIIHNVQKILSHLGLLK